MISPFKKAAVFGIGVYQKYISKELNSSMQSHCIFTPSCSEYTKQAIDRHGLFSGGMEGIMRLSRCTPEVRMAHAQKFLALLPSALLDPSSSVQAPYGSPPSASRTNGSTFNGPDSPASLPLRWENEGVRKKLLLLQGHLREAARLQKEGKLPEAGTEIMSGKEILGTLQVRTIDEVNLPYSSPTFLVQEKGHCHGAVAGHGDGVRSSDTTRTRAALLQAARYGGGIAGAVAGGALGAVTALFLGIAAGAVVGSGAVGKVNNLIAKHYGGDSVWGFAKLERTLGSKAYWIQKNVKEKTGSIVLASAAGTLIGTPVSAIIGLYEGIVSGVRGGFRMGGILSRNLADSLAEKLSPSLPAAPLLSPSPAS